MNLPESFVRINDREEAQQYYIEGRHLSDEERELLTQQGIQYNITPDFGWGNQYQGTIVTIYPYQSAFEAGSSYIMNTNTSTIRWSRKRGK